MDQDTLSQALSGLGYGPLHYQASTGSTNTDAAAWADGRGDRSPASDLSLVVADEQTRGRGRQGRRWHTPPGAALAFSLILLPEALDRAAPGAASLDPSTLLGRLTALGALAVCQALRLDYALPAWIKWPNDVLINRHKVCGILAEAQWSGTQLAAVILGIGVNVSPKAIPPAQELIYPATSIESQLNAPVDRPLLLRHILERLLEWRARLAAPEFWQTWEALLAFKGEWVQVVEGISPSPGLLEQEGAPGTPGLVLGLNPDGSLRLQALDGTQWALRTGELHIRPQDWL